MIVSEQDYNDAKRMFFRLHDNDFECETQGSSAEYYRKTYVFKDKAIWYEVMMRETTIETIEYKKCKVPVQIDVMKTEYWNSNDSTSCVWYQPWDVMCGNH